MLRCGKGQCKAKQNPCKDQATTLASKCTEAEQPTQQQAGDAQMRLKQIPKSKPDKQLLAP